MPEVFDLGHRRGVRLTALMTGVAAFCLVLIALLAPVAMAEDTDPWTDDAAHWLCRPGDSPDPCEGDLNTKLYTPALDPGFESIARSVNPNAPVDCFYVYPTQSEQDTPNANWDKDPELLRPTINQAAPFSRNCRVFAPMYRQYTYVALGDPEVLTDEVRDLAYGDIVDAWNTYLEKYNQGRGVIFISHSQGTSHLARMINEIVDPDPAVRRLIVGGFLIGGNVYVPKGKLVGGQFQNLPGCESGDQAGCVVAYSAYRAEPEANSDFGRVETGYWVNPNPRPDPAEYEVLCVNPAGFNGDDGHARTLANIPAFLNPGNPPGPQPWSQYDGYFNAECMNQNGASWLQVSESGETLPPLLDMVIEQAASGNNLHTADVNLALDNMVEMAATQTVAWQQREATRKQLTQKRNQLIKKRNQLQKKVKRLQKQKKQAAKKCKKARKQGKRNAKKLCKKPRQIQKQIKKTRNQIKQTRKQIQQANRQLNQLD